VVGYVDSLRPGGKITEMTDPNSDFGQSLRLLRSVCIAVYHTQDATSASYNFSILIRGYFGSSRPEYRSFACTMASAISNNVIIYDIPREEDIDGNAPDCGWRERIGGNCGWREIHALCDIAFSAFTLNKLMVEGENANLYHLVHTLGCYSKGRSNICSFYLYAGFCATLQLGLAVYVVAHLKTVHDGDGLIDSMEMKNVALAIAVLIFAMIFCRATIMKWYDVYSSKFWDGSRLLVSIDFLVNMATPVLLMPAGFFLIATSGEFMDAVLNSTALLFIPLLDDELPALLGMDARAIVQSYILRKSVDQLDQIGATYDTKDAFRPVRSLKNPPNYFDILAIGSIGSIESIDLFQVLNNTNKNANAKLDKDIDGNLKHDKERAPLVLSTEVINAFSLFTCARFRMCTTKDGQQRIFELELERLGSLGSGEEVLKFNFDRKSKWRKTGVPWHTVRGVFVITGWDSSQLLFQLRLFGAKTAAEFKEALGKFSLWDLEPGAASLIKRHGARAASGHKPTAGQEIPNGM
jgi:hypothetical protein